MTGWAVNQFTEKKKAKNSKIGYQRWTQSTSLNHKIATGPATSLIEVADLEVRKRLRKVVIHKIGLKDSEDEIIFTVIYTHLARRH